MFSYHDSIDTIPAGALIVGIEATIPAHRAVCAFNIDPQHGGGDLHAVVAHLAIVEAEVGCEYDLYEVTESIFDASATADDEGRPVTALTLAAAIEWQRVAQVVGRPIAFLTSRPDLDALASMALADLDAIAEILPEGDGYHGQAEVEMSIAEDSSVRGCFDLWARVALVEAADAFSAGTTPWVPSPLPTVDHPWIGAVGGVDTRRELAAVNAACFDRTVPLADRVATVRRWLVTGEEPAYYRERVETRRLDLIRQAVVKGHGRCRPAVNLPCADDMVNAGDQSALGWDIATVVVDLPGATGLGYCLAPRVVCESPNFRLSGGAIGRKFTVTSWAPPERAVFEALIASLNEAERLAGGDPTWGGNPASGIAGSSQTRASALTLDQVVTILKTFVA